MKGRIFEVTLTTVALAAGSVLLQAGPAAANHALFPRRASSYRTPMVRAMDPCVPSGVSVVGTVDDPAVGCLQSNVVTDETPDSPGGDPLGASMSSGFLSVNATAGPGFNGRVHFFGLGFQTGQRVKVRLTLRGTRTNTQVKHPPGSFKRVTYADVTIECGNQTAGCFAARPSGAIVGTQSLSDCLAQNGEKKNLRLGNIEILNAELVNCDTGKTIAVPGIKNASRGVR